MIERLVVWSLQFIARIVVAGLLGNAVLSTFWRLIDRGGRTSDAPLCWFGCSLVVGGVTLAVVTVLFPGSKPAAPGEILTQLAACLAACCVGCILVPIGLAVAFVRFFLP